MTEESFNWCEDSPQVREHVQREVERLSPDTRRAARALYDLDWGADTGDHTPGHEIIIPLRCLFVGKPPGRSFSLSLCMPCDSGEVELSVREEILDESSETLRLVGFVEVPLEQLASTQGQENEA